VGPAGVCLGTADRAAVSTGGRARPLTVEQNGRLRAGQWTRQPAV